MRTLIWRWSLTAIVLHGTAATTAVAQDTTLTVSSPDRRNVATVAIREGGLYYAVARDDRNVIIPSRLGLEFRDAPPLRDGLRIAAEARNSVDRTWTQSWGQVERVRDHHNELRVTVEETTAPGRSFRVAFRAFDDGIAFRYEVPAQPGLAAFEMTAELTDFTLATDARAWWIPAGLWNRYEFLYSASPASRLPLVHTPLTLEMQDGLHVVIHEANLVDYAAMNLEGTGTRTLRASLAPWADSVLVRGNAPFVSPWRTIEMADRAADLQPALMALNLNPPSVLEDTDWIEPMKYVGIWWGMHIGTMTWHSGPKHGATTENAKRYIDFAAANGLGGVLIEGWNIGWDGDWMANADRFSFTQPYPDFDLAEVARYAEQRGVELIGHHETSMGVENYEHQMEAAFALYDSLDINAVKTGYVGDRTAEGHAHHGQYMVNHWRRVLETAARHQVMVNVHEPIKDTGERRTYPNMMTREGARGMEYNAWGGEGGNPPEHETILFFTRMHAGPMDFTPGVFDILISSADGEPREPDESRVRTTLAKQLALYVVLYSPLQMAADLPANYEDRPAFEFIREVPVNWETSRVLDGRIGDYVIVARQRRDDEEWYIGAITDEEARTFDIPLSFLEPGRRYVAEVYADAPDAHWLTNPGAISIDERPVDADMRLTLTLAPGGGQAIRIRPAQ
ncbi:MAG: glycoside hydrolase family 97 protein [Longimicrobiales bacterium]